MQRPDSQHAGSTRRITPLLLLVLLLAGCSSGWKAPLEVRDQRPTSQSQYQTFSGTSYTVRRGDTLYSIAWRAGKDFKQLAGWNRIPSPYTIFPGQVLRLTPPPAAKNTARTSRSKPMKSTAQTSKAGNTSSKAGSTSSKSRKSPASHTPPVRAGTLHWAWPANGQLIARFAANDQTRQGIKIAGNEGQPIKAAEKGRVVYSGSGLVGYGRLIIVKHNDKYLSAYGHNRRLLVKEGEQVAKGQRIAEMGRSNDGKPILHFEIRRVGKPVDPLPLLPRR